jgi:hypothetical protein
MRVTLTMMARETSSTRTDCHVNARRRQEPSDVAGYAEDAGRNIRDALVQSGEIVTRVPERSRTEYTQSSLRNEDEPAAVALRQYSGSTTDPHERNSWMPLIVSATLTVIGRMLNKEKDED